MNPVRIIIILVAGVAAIALALVVRNMTVKPAIPQHAEQTVQQPMTRVLVAKADLAVGDRLTADNMAWQPWPAATLNAAYVSDGSAGPAKPDSAAAAVKAARATVTDIATAGGPKMQSMVGSIVREPIYAGEPITSRKVVRGGDSGYMAVRLPSGMRAMSLAVNSTSDVAGFIQPGDRVDVLLTHPDTSKESSGQPVTSTVLPNAKVLAIDQRTDTPKAGATTPGATVTLEVPVSSVETLARATAASGGTITLALRSYADLGRGAANDNSGDGSNLHVVRLFKGGAPAQLVMSK